MPSSMSWATSSIRRDRSSTTESALKEAMDEADLGDDWRRVVADMAGGPATFMLPQVAHGWHLNLIALNGVVDSEATSAPSEEPTDRGRRRRVPGHRAVRRRPRRDLRLGRRAHPSRDRGGRPARRRHGAARDGRPVVPDSRRSTGRSRCRWQRLRRSTRSPAAYGKRVIRPGRSRRALAAAVLEGRAKFAGSTSGGFIFGDFFPAYDGVLSTGMAARMLAKSGMTLAQVVAELPEFHKVEISVPCPARRKGAVMRSVTERAAEFNPELAGGRAGQLLGRMGARSSARERTVSLDMGRGGKRCIGRRREPSSGSGWSSTE